jgi:hypothetical protein
MRIYTVYVRTDRRIIVWKIRARSAYSAHSAAAKRVMRQRIHETDIVVTSENVWLE